MPLQTWLSHALTTSPDQQQLPPQSLELMAARLLTRVDSSLFGGFQFEALPHNQKPYDAIIHLIQRYLIRRQCKKFKKEYVRRLCSLCRGQDLIAIVFYLCVNSDISSEVVGDIMEFNSQDQRELMERYKEVDSNLEKIVQLRQVIQKIETIEEDNQRLRDYLQSQEAELSTHIQQIWELKANNQELQELQHKSNSEKTTIFKELQISELEEFKDLCLLLSRHNTQVSQTIEEGNEEHQRLMQRNQQLKRELQSYAKTIRSQMEEVQRLKSWYSIYCQESLLKSEVSYEAFQSEEVIPLGDNKNILNTPRCPKPETKQLLTDRTHCSSHQQQLDQHTSKNNLGDLLKVSQLEEDKLLKEALVRKLRHQINNEKERNRRLDRKVAKIRNTHQHYAKRYFQTVALA